MSWLERKSVQQKVCSTLDALEELKQTSGHLSSSEMVRKHLLHFSEISKKKKIVTNNEE